MVRKMKSTITNLKEVLKLKGTIFWSLSFLVKGCLLHSVVLKERDAHERKQGRFIESPNSKPKSKLGLEQLTLCLKNWLGVQWSTWGNTKDSRKIETFIKNSLRKKKMVFYVFMLGKRAMITWS